MFVLLFAINALTIGVQAHSHYRSSFEGCDYQQNMSINQKYYVHNVGFPDYYKPGTSCRWKAEALPKSHITLNCQVLQIPDIGKCEKQHLSVSFGNSTTKTQTELFCGEGNFTYTYTTNSLTIVLQSDPSSLGGRFDCTIVAHPPKPSKKCDCAIKKKTKALGGEETKINEYPMMAAMLCKAGEVFCGATIISNRYLLTTAKCAKSEKASIKDMRVLVGDHDITIGYETSAAKKYAVENIIIHDRFKKSPSQNNIAILVTKAEITFSAEVQPVCLPFGIKGNQILGGKVTAMGWGKKNNEEQVSKVLNKVEVDVVSLSYCEKHYSISLDQKSFCTYTPLKSTCQEDSGGPVLYEEPDGNSYLVGIIMSKWEVCNEMAPNVHINVSAYLDWIVKRTKDAKYCEAKLEE